MAVGAGTELQRCLLLCAEWEALTREGGHIVIVPFIQRKEVRATSGAILVKVFRAVLFYLGTLGK